MAHEPQKKNGAKGVITRPLTPYIEAILPDEPGKEWTYEQQREASPLAKETIDQYMPPQVDIEKRKAVVGMTEERNSQISRNEALAEVRCFDPLFTYEVKEKEIIRLAKDMALHDTLQANGMDHRHPDMFPLHNKQIGRFGMELMKASPEELVKLMAAAYTYGGQEYMDEFAKKLNRTYKRLAYTHKDKFTQFEHDLVGLFTTLSEHVPIGVQLAARDHMKDSVKGDYFANEMAKVLLEWEQWGNKQYSNMVKAAKQRAAKEAVQQDKGTHGEESEAQRRRKVEEGSKELQNYQEAYERDDYASNFEPDGVPKPYPTYQELDDFFHRDPTQFPIRWGRAYLNNKIKLTRSLPPGLRGRSVKATDTGGVLKYPQRWCGDKDIFGQKKMTHEGGAVLIDTSGSMSLRDDEILKIMTKLPGAIIATYAGRHLFRRDGEIWHGEIRIIARKGKRAEVGELQPPYGGNEIDGPSVDWLCMQEGPRYWVTDSGVTYVTNWETNPVHGWTVGENLAARYMYTELMRKVRSHKVVIVPNARALIRDL